MIGKFEENSPALAIPAMFELPPMALGQSWAKND